MAKRTTQPRYVFTFEPLPEVKGEAPVTIRLRWLLKWALRDLRLRCKSAEEVRPPTDGETRPEGVVR
jgi:hypothetical protein